MFPTLINALRETLYMVLYAGLLSALIGVPLGVFIASIANNQQRWISSVHFTLNMLVQLANSIPYLLVMLLFIPTTNWLITRNISYTTATILPLAVAGTLYLAHNVNNILSQVLSKWRSTTKAMGASQKQTLLFIALPECFASIVQAVTNTCSLLVGFSIIAGALGAGGLGQLAIEKTITEPNLKYSLISIAALVAIQQLIKYTGLLVVQHKE
jgi:ABC-type methionine transport system permease subunit